jgi:autotransporter-associated beta strand protein
MKTNSHNPIPWLLASGLLAGSAAWAAVPVTITNPGFEEPVLEDGDVHTGTIPGWSGFNGGAIAVLNPTSSGDLTAQAPEGENVGVVTGSADENGFAQTLASAFIADADYALTLKVANTKFTAGFPGYRVQLVAGGTVIAEDDNSQTVAEDGVVTSTVNYTYDVADAALVGQPLEVRLLSKGLSAGTEVAFDDAQLTVTLLNPLAVPGGPYAVFVGGSLLLNGSGSMPSDGATLTTYEWDLDNDGDFDEAITGATPAAISQADLVATFGMSLGSNPIKLRVTDSATKTSTVETTVNILPGTAVIYEPFAYAGTALNGASGNNEVGFSAPWVASGDTKLSSNLAYGSLLTKGAGIGNLAGGQNRFGGGRAISAAALANNGLLADGATLWFSVIMGYDSGGNRTNSRLAFALANNSFSASNNNYNINNSGTGSGLGVTVGRFNNVNGRIVATQFTDGPTGAGVGFGSNVFGTGQTTNVLPGTNTSVDYKLVVGRIQWGASDTIDLFIPNPDMSVDLNTPHSSLTVSVDQSGYDTISFARGDRMVMDEIRFGASYASVTDTGTYWDLNGDVAGAGSATPSGTWGSDSNWGTKPDGTAATGPWAPGGTAVFSAGNDATGVYTITVDGTRDVAGLTFEDGTVSVTGGTALRLTANGSVSVAAGLTANISTPFVEDVTGRELSKSGAGTLILSGDNSGVTGGMILSGGATRFESPAAIAGSARNITINPSGTAVFGPGFGSGNIPAALLDRIVATSPGTIAADNQESTGFDFETAGLIDVSLGAVGNVSYTGTLTPNGTTYRLGGGGGTLTMANTNALTGENSLNVRGSVVLAAANDYTGPTVVNGGAALRILGSTGTSGISVNQPAGFLEVGDDGALGTGTLTINGGFATGPTLSVVGTVVTSNPVVVNGELNITGSGSLTVGPVTLGGTDRNITNNNTGLITLGGITATNTNLTLSGNGSTTAGAITTGTGALTKNGSGTLTLTGANTYTGNTTITGGGLSLVGGSHGSAITVNSGVTLGFTLGSPTTSTAALNLSAGHVIAITGAVNNASDYPLMTASSIVGTPTLALEIPNYSLELRNGNTELWLAFAGGGTPYETWATGGELFEEDANGDGVKNGLAFLLGAANPAANALGLLPAASEQNNGDLVLTFSMRNAANRGAATLAVQWSSDLGATDLWSANQAVVPEDDATVNGVVFDITPGDPLNTVTATLPAAEASGGKLFSRLKGAEN